MSNWLLQGPAKCAWTDLVFGRQVCDCTSVCVILLYLRQGLHLELVRLCGLLTFMLPGSTGSFKWPWQTKLHLK